MVLCSRCGADNTLDSKFCRYCGTPVGDMQATPHQGAPAPPKDFAQGIADAGKRLGDEMGPIGERFGRDIANWWDSTLGILSPVVLGFFGVVLILFGLFVTDIIASRADSPQFWEGLGDFIVNNFLVLAGLMFLGAFHMYFYRRYRTTFRWLGPIVSAAIFTGWAWVFAQVLILAGRHSEHPGFGDAGRLIESLLILIFVFGVLVGYAILWFSLVSPANWDKPEQKN